MILVYFYFYMLLCLKIKLGESNVLHYFGNAGRTRCFCQGCVREEPHWTVKCRGARGNCRYGSEPAEVFAIWATFHEQCGFNTEINCTFNFLAANVFGCFHCDVAQSGHVNINSRNTSRCTFICVFFKSQDEWSNAQWVSAVTTTTLRTTASVMWNSHWKIARTYIMQNF